MNILPPELAIEYSASRVGTWIFCLLSWLMNILPPELVHEYSASRVGPWIFFRLSWSLKILPSELAHEYCAIWVGTWIFDNLALKMKFLLLVSWYAEHRSLRSASDWLCWLQWSNRELPLSTIKSEQSCVYSCNIYIHKKNLFSVSKSQTLGSTYLFGIQILHNITCPCNSIEISH